MIDLAYERIQTEGDAYDAFVHEYNLQDLDDDTAYLAFRVVTADEEANA